MISTSILILSTCALASAVGQPYNAYAFAGGWNPGFQPGFAAWNPNFGQHFNNFAWFPKPQNNGPWITTEDGVYKIVVKANGYQIEDMKVKIKDDSIMLRGDVMGSNSKSFSYSYGMPDEGNANEATAVLTSNGYLVVSIPLTGSVGDVERVVPITESGEKYIRSED